MTTSLFRKCAPVVALMGLGLTACQPDIEDDFTPSAGSVDFTRYIAVGNSLTAGFQDNGLYLEGQQKSYPALLAEQFRAVGGGEFVQPLFPVGQENGSGYLRLTGIVNGAPVTASVPGNAGRNPSAPGAAPYTRFDGRVDNLGVPGIRLADIHTANFGNLAQQPSPPTAATFNPYFERITPVGNSQSYFQRVKAEAATATFFSNWLGNNDILGYATTGGLGGIITRTDTFTLKNNRIINSLTATGAKGIVATIPDVTTIPFFTTVRVPNIRASFKARNAALDVYIQTTGANGATVVRLATDADLLTLPSSAVIGTNPTNNTFPIGAGVGAGIGQSNPVPNQFVLDATEQATVRNATTAFNTAITNKANEKGLAIFDSNTFFSGIAQRGLVTNGVSNTTSFVSGNLFSLDGVHPTPRGYAVVANEMIKAINAKYGSRIAQVNPNNYRGVQFPR